MFTSFYLPLSLSPLLSLSPQITKRKQIEEVKAPKGGKCGVLPCVTVFNEFAERAESIVAAVGRRTELDKAYLPLMEVLFKTVERMAHEHAKTPPDVIKFGEP